MTGSPGQRWSWGGASQLGGRAEQQDRWGVFSTPEQDGLLAAVADGMGGHQDGALGAQAVLETVEGFIRSQAQALRRQPGEALGSLCEQCQTAIGAASARARSTLVTLWLYRDQVYWMHVGDSRFYHLRAGQRLLRTRDHSAAQMLLDLGEIDEADIPGHPDQHRLYRSLGGEGAPKPEIGCGRVTSDDLLVLCSDGLWERVSEAELWTAGRQTLVEAAAALVEQAVARAGPEADNATVVLVRPQRRAFGNWAWLRRALPARAGQ